MGPLRPDSPARSIGPGWRSRAPATRLIDDAEFQSRYGDRIATLVPEAARPQPRRLGDALRTMESSRPEEVLRGLLGFAGARYSRAVLFAVRPGNPGAAVAWEGMGPGLDPVRVRRLFVALRPGSVVEQAVSCRSPVLGPLPPTEANQRLASDLGGDAPTSALLVPVLAAGQPLAVLYADDGPRTSLGSDVGEVLVLAGMAGRALGSNLARARRGGTKVSGEAG